MRQEKCRSEATLRASSLSKQERGNGLDRLLELKLLLVMEI